ncbi:hypothetical protein REPUB_Repub19eG0108400 [Reevesia pubescens]
MAETEAGKKEDLIIKSGAGEEILRDNNNNGAWFKEKKGSVFPVKRKFVKTMMVECLAKSLSSLSISPEVASLSSKVGCSSKILSATSSKFKKPSKGLKRMEIFPDYP